MPIRRTPVSLLSPVYFAGLSPISILYAAMGTLSARYRAQARVRGIDSNRQPILKGKRHGTDGNLKSLRKSCEPPLRPLSRSSLFFLGTDSRGNWVVRDQAGLCGGLFINRSEALRFAMLENGRRPRAVIMVPGILEFSIGGPAKAVAKDSTGVVEAKAQPTTAHG